MPDFSLTVHCLFFSSPDIPELPPEQKTEPPSNLVSLPAKPVVNADENVPSKEDTFVGKPCPIIRKRYSESEDSDCGLVIDLDRRLSVEERGKIIYLSELRI